jgi:phosphatidylglycerol lysyltransferase
MILSWLHRNGTILSGLLMVIVGVAILFAARKLTADVSYDSVLAALDRTRSIDILAAIILTGISFACLICYDLNALRFIRRPQPLVSAGLVAFSAYAVGNTAGFGPLSGGAIRYRGYARLCTAIATLIFSVQVQRMTGYPAPLLAAMALALLLAAVGGLWWIGRRRPAAIADFQASGKRLSLPPPRTILLQLAITAGDIAAAASVLYVLLPGESAIHWPAFTALYCIAIGLGVLSHVPAGLGVFEAVILAAVGPSVPTGEVIGALVLYRLIYHVMPLFIAVVVLIGSEIAAYRKLLKVLIGPHLGPAILPVLLAVIAVICASMLIFSSVLPTPDANLAILENLLPTAVVEAAHFVSSLLGLVLFVSARGLAHRLDGAWWTALITALAAMILCFPKAIAPFEAMLLGLFILGLLLSRSAFARRSTLLAEPLTASWITALAVLLAAAFILLMFVLRDVKYSSQLWWQFEISADAPRGLHALAGVSLLAIALTVASLLRPSRRQLSVASDSDIARAVAITESNAESGGNLVRTGDKSVMFSEDERAFIMYAVQGRSQIALFGAIGADEARPGLLWSFVEAARSDGRRAVLYEVPSSLLPACADMGLRALKLGEMAVVDLKAMDLASSRWGEQRRALAKAERDGMRLEILLPEEVGFVLDDIARISDDWLAHHEVREKGFALGRFSGDYLASQPLAVLRQHDKIVAFASVMLAAAETEASIDLMRFGNDAPKGAMDFLFAALLVAMRERGFARFNLGMAPLSGFAAHSAAPLWNRFGQAIFTHGEKFYNFRGLRAFKAKFNPSWEPRYLVVDAGTAPVAALMDVTLLIGGGIRGVVSR